MARISPWPPLRHGLAGRRALVVEDLPALRYRIEHDLATARVHVASAVDYHGAVRVLRAWAPHVAIINLTLPRESGYELCEFIRVRDASTPIIVMDERDSPEDLAYAEEVGANAFLKKPFTREQLLEYVDAMLLGPWVSRPFGVRFLSRALRRGAGI